MANDGEWTLKNRTLTDGTAQKEYGISREFILQGIRANKLEYREVSMYGNPCLRILRRQLEQYITEELGAQYLKTQQSQAELRRIKTEINSLKRKLAALEKRKKELES